MAPSGARMQNADRAVIEFITARPANYPVAGSCSPCEVPSQSTTSAPLVAPPGDANPASPLHIFDH